MSRKMNFIPPIPNYDWIRQQMQADLDYRLTSRTRKTSLGRPLYERINVQLITTQECPYHCPFCLERKNPMCGVQDQAAQIRSLEMILAEHPSARLTITGGEPGLYPDHVSALVRTFHAHSDNVFLSINTAGYNSQLANLAHINLSVNEYVHPDLSLFPNCTYQTVLPSDKMTLKNLKEIIESTGSNGAHSVKSFSFRFLSGLEKQDYPVSIWNELMADPEIHVSTFRVGDFFVYATFDYQDTHNRVTLGDMFQQQHNAYRDGYSNIIIHPDGKFNTNWK